MLFRLTRGAGCVALIAWPMLAFAAETSPEADTANGVSAAKPSPQAPAPASTSTRDKTAGVPPMDDAKLHTAATGTDAQRFCQNVANAAAEARVAWQAKKLADLQERVQQTIADLEVRETALKESLAKRDDALKRAGVALVGIFAKMKPDAAAAQLSALDDETAAAVLQQLNPRSASAILDEITPDRAVRLVNTIAGKDPADGKKS